MKITVSSWPGAGATTLALLLANVYKLKLLAGGKVFRHLYEQISVKDSIVEGPKLVEPYFGPIFDKFTQELLVDAKVDNLLIESDIASFRIGKINDIVSIFLYASDKFREKRINADARSNEAKIIKKIDSILQVEYKNLYGFDFLDIEAIKATHFLPIDNTHIPISKELEIVNEYIQKHFSNKFIEEMSYISLVDTYNLHGKEYFKNILEKEGLIYHVEEILEEIKRRFKAEVSKLPMEIRRIL